jgi:hypothetical protein
LEATSLEIKTASWFTDLPPGHVKIGISRGNPRHMAGFRIYRALAPSPWFSSATVDEYELLYRTEILDRLDSLIVAARLVDLARGSIPVLVCFEPAGRRQWCHRALAAAWLSDALGRPVPEVGFETLPQVDHPLRPARLTPNAVDSSAGVSATSRPARWRRW